MAPEPFVDTYERRGSRHSHQWDRSSYDNVSARPEPQPLTEISLREMVEESVREAMREMKSQVATETMEIEIPKVKLPYGNLNRRKLRIRR